MPMDRRAKQVADKLREIAACMAAAQDHINRAAVLAARAS